ncbi:cytochrome bc complex cytochrome b subunit [Rhodoferax sp. BAB1]|uniref:cytochrome b n=1 Tax=Rhodoferax sp. BAB1 TaxID=2741720 RepID=UPI0015776C85|nr:cytochrome bc complex cytochrome b subunit [Rhodoferax sp. BAB1]QKO22805.1 cytochrome bc complex cytochrome b subunit [Rhodoferax sp. BAB1]
MAEFKEIAADAPVVAKVTNWLENRFPTAFDAYRVHMSEYYAPKNFNFWYFFGSLAMLVLVIQIVTGIFLVMHYKPDAALAFGSVEYIMRDVPWGWLVRYMHSTGASAFFVVVYLHMFRGLIYGSYRKPRELVWIFGCAIFLVLMAEAFMGYLLPWGQMSYWGAQVIVNLFSAIPFIGPDLALLIRGDYVVGDATLNRFFSFHVIAVPLVLLGLVVAHLLALHDVGSNNPDGVEIKGPNAPKDAKGKPLDGIPFHPYYTVHDIMGVSVFLMVFSAIVFFAPEFGGYFLEYNNFIPADPLKTPAHIAPVWYFTPYYSMLRAITTEMMYALIACVVLAAALGVLRTQLSMLGKGVVMGAALVLIALMLAIDAKFWGVVVMGGAVVILFFLPWLDNCAVKSIRYRPDWHKVLYGIFVINFVILAYLGVQAPSPIGERVSQVGTLFYFGFFLLMPWWSRLGQTKPVPSRVTFEAH